jgi:hypothetical protein
MKKILLLIPMVLFLFSCQKEETVTTTSTSTSSTTTTQSKTQINITVIDENSVPQQGYYVLMLDRELVLNESLNISYILEEEISDVNGDVVFDASKHIPKTVYLYAFTKSSNTYSMAGVTNVTKELKEGVSTTTSIVIR